MNDGMQRRDFIQGAGLLAGVAAATALTEQPGFAQAAAHAGAKPMSYEAKPLSLDPKTSREFPRRCSSAITRITTSAR